MTTPRTLPIDEHETKRAPRGRETAENDRESRRPEPTETARESRRPEPTETAREHRRPERPDPARGVERTRFDTDVAEVLLGRPPRLVQVPALVLGLLVVVATIWAFVAQVDRVVTCSGTVADHGRSYTLETPFGGEVETVRVRPGDAVHRDEALLVLDTSEVESRIEELDVRIEYLSRECTAIEKLVGLHEASTALADRRLALEHALAEDEHEQRERARELAERESRLGIERAALEAELLEKTHERYARGDRQSVAEIEVETARVRRDLARLDLARVRELEDYRAAGRPLESAASARRVRHAGLTRSQSEIDSRISLEELRLRRIELEAELDRLEVERRRLEHNRRDNILRSPADGVVVRAWVARPGEVLEAGSPAFEISPGELVMKGLVRNRDRGELERGQRVDIELAAFPREEYGRFHGELLEISPETVDATSPFFEVTVSAPDPARFEAATGRPLRLGYRGEMSIVTGRETVAEKLLGRRFGREGKRP